ncbi:GNAT family N-acetyltransferase [Hymenobacter ruricola]|uniref:GNAT family N-acetyltransferase n=1 Tax=Hymenobacter ruricola TaxID=2791023 RepID=A0ABS0HZX9_9BACT|nr:GNAT family N-acetyltransferase [Hymenobacter ruricola]MBF9220250.1 GNAT family N-acetyltransferase [Hymenobacter ruricola]
MRHAIPRRLEAPDLEWAVALLGQAMAAHPALSYVCAPPIGARRQHWLLRQLLDYVFRHGVAYTNAAGTALVLWLHPTELRRPWALQLRLLLPAIWWLGWAGSQRLRRLIRTVAWLRRQSLAGPHHLLLGVAVHPAAQGRGEGRRLLAATLALRQSPLPCYFSGQVPSQLAFYQGLGFELAGHCTVGEGPAGVLSNWGLLRPAARK